MGRTKRHRQRLSNKKNVSLDALDDIICLKRWMHARNWKNNTKLILRNFESTGRGLSSNANINISDRLIEIPFNLMITVVTLENCDIFEAVHSSGMKFTSQELLGLFLAIEKHKGKSSTWYPYINSLPDTPPLPWLCTEDQLQMVPSPLQDKLINKRRMFDTCWERVQKGIISSYTCPCCGNAGNFIVTLDLFTWGYVMVDTRAVYVNFQIVNSISARILEPYLLDMPCHALCPFLDMFNHSQQVITDAKVIFEHGEWIYVLTALNRQMKHEQIFVSYGDHDNVNLICLYGFLLRPNILDDIYFTFEELCLICKIKIDADQYRCLGRDNLYISSTGLSFNLKALLYVAHCTLKSDWNRIVFNESYTNSDLILMHTCARSLLSNKFQKFSEDVNLLTSCQIKSQSFSLIVEYFKYRLELIKELIVFTERCINKL